MAVTRVYKCDTCNNTVEIQCGIKSPANPRPCGVADCPGTMRVVIQPVAVRFKGSGWTRSGTTRSGKAIGTRDIHSPAYYTGDGETVPPVKINRVTGESEPVSMEEHHADLSKQRPRR